MRAFDWEKTAIGPVSSWSPTLRTMVPFLLANRFPLLLWWGPEYVQLYNDAYIPVLGKKHPHPGLGMPVRECWDEIWHVLKPLIDRPFTGGDATWAEDLELEIFRHGFVEETHFTVAYSPVPDPTAPGGVGGVLATVHEITQQVIQERRVRTLRDLGARMLGSQRAENAARAACAVLEGTPKDTPFTMVYLDGTGSGARLAATAGATPGSPCAPMHLATHSDGGQVWPIAESLSEGRPVVVSDIESRCAPVPAGPWSVPPTQAIVLPIPSRIGEASAGAVVFGVSARLALDELYRSFFELAAAQIATAVSNARAYEVERKRAEALAELDRAKTTFFSNLSHEFRTPLTLMLGPLEDMLTGDDEPLGPQARERLSVAQRNALRLLRLVNTLLDFSRVEAGRAQASFEATDLARFTADLASNFRSTMERAGLTFHVNCGALSEPLYVDRAMWEKVVLNLLSNAFKFTLDGGIEVALSERETDVELRVTDTGCGIPDQELARVFERFHRVEGTKGRSYEGSGIGLALVQELVKALGGTVSVESELGRGSTFRVVLPKGTTHLMAERIRASRELASTAGSATSFVQEALGWLRGGEQPEPSAAFVTRTPLGPRPRIVVADDNADLREYIVRLLADQYEVEAVGDGQAAVRAAADRPPDLVLADVMMPKLDGFAVLRALRAEPRTAELPIVLLSARAGEEARIEGLEAGADDYLVKPFSGRELVARVSATLGRARARREATEERIRLLERERDAERRAERERENLRAVCASLPAPVTLLEGPNHIVRFANRAMLRVWRKREADVLGRPLFAAVPEHENEVHWKTLLDEVFRTGVPYIGHEERAEFDRGGVTEDLFFTYVYSPTFDVEGQVEGVFVLSLDVTAEVRTRQEAERLRSVAESANRAKDEFLAVLSHELRTPMNAMLGWVRILKSAGARDPDLVRKAVSTLERNIWVQAQVIDDLLDVSRILSGKLQLEEDRLELVALVHGCVESLRPSAEGKHVALNLADDDQELDVIGDSGRLQQVVGNLVGNAIKFTDSGGVVSVTLGRDDGSALLVVEDSGVGIAPELLPHIFDRFRQADSSSVRRHGGLGLGLSIVKTLVELHGGMVRAFSEGPQRGSRFEVRLPLAAARNERVAFTPHSVPRRIRSANLGALDILIVEDDEDSRLALEVALTEYGLRVRSAASVRQALDAYDTAQPDVVISDIAMPGEDGYSLIRAIREREKAGSNRTLAIAMTGFAGRQDQEMAMRAGFDEHVAKPVEPDVLLERIHALVGSRSIHADKTG